MHNHGNYIISLGNLCRWLATQAEELGVEIFPGFAAAEVLYDGDGAVKGVATGDMGVGKDGEPTASFAPGVELIGRQTLFAEGARGSLTKTLLERFGLAKDSDPQTYGLGIKELWEVEPAKSGPAASFTRSAGRSTGDTYGGSFLYHLEDNQVAVGFVVGLDYSNPFLSPFEEFQRFKTHPSVRPLFVGGRRISYGARAISAGGLQSLPKLTFPGGALIGDAAGFLNVPKIKGSHTAMKSGMVAAESVVALLKGGTQGARGDRLSGGAEKELALGRTFARAQHQAGVQMGPLAGDRLFRDRHLSAARQGALDAASQARSSGAEAGRRIEADRLSKARWNRQLRPALLGVRLQHQPRRESARASEAEGSEVADQDQSRPL